MSNMRNGITLLVTAIVILVVGILAFVTISGSISGPQASASMNTTMESGATFFNIAGLVVIIGSILVVLTVVSYYVSTPQRYKKHSARIEKIIKFLQASTQYFGYGLLCIVILAVPAFLTWFLFQYTVVEGNVGSLFEVLKWVGILVGLYFGIAGIGYLFKKKIVDKWRKRREENKKKYDLSELPGSVS